MQITTIEDAMKFIYRTSWKGSQLGLSRIKELMELLGNPQRRMKFVHISGTNGKGSTAAMLASILSEAGYKTGLYTSPPLHRFEERIRIDGKLIAESELVTLANHFQQYVNKMQDPPTEFEVITAMALYYFHEMQCDIVALEVGMGGRLDATGVIGTPEVAVITSIDLDHTAELGDTVEKIAGEEAGIIKSNGVVVCHPQIETVKQVIRMKCKEQSGRVTFVDNDAIKAIAQSLECQSFEYCGIKNLSIPLLGSHQLYNAAAVIETVHALRERGWNISDNALRNGFKKTSWPGRFEIVKHSPVFIVDSAHNPQAVESAVDTLCMLFPKKKFLFLFGVLADKDYQTMFDILILHASRFITVTPDNPRGLQADKLNFERCIVPIDTCESVEQGVRFAIESSDEDDIICSLGSLSMVGQVREYLLSL